MENVKARWWGLYACCEDSSGKGSGGSKVMSGKQVAWVVGLESENVDTGIGSARGSGERRQGNAMWAHMDGTGGDFSEDE